MLDRKFLLGTTIVAGLAATTLMGPTVALAQTAPAAATPATEAEDSDEEGDVSALVITGSRIKRTEFTSAAPIQVVTSEQAALEGLVDTSEILQQSSVASGSFQVNGQLTGYLAINGQAITPGANYLSLRGLGANRTLILLNGRRLGPAGVSGQVGPVDLNTIPSSLIDRAEILKDGASSVYGSDAVAGVVNIITRTNLDGAELSVYGNQPFESGGESWRLNGSWGKTFDRGYVNGSFDWYHSEGLRRGERDDTACNADYLFTPESRRRIDHLDIDTGKPMCWNILNNTIRTSTLGDLVFTRPGVVYPTAAQGNNSPVVGMARTSRAGYPLTYPYRENTHPVYDKSTVLYPVDRYSLFASGGVDLTGSLELYGELMFNRRETEQYSASNFTPARVSNSLGQTTSGITSGHIYNRRPDTGTTFGQTITPIIARGIGSDQKVDYYRGLIGLRGDFGGFLQGWDWDIYGQYSYSDGEYNTEYMYTDRLSAVSETLGPGQYCTNTPVGGNKSNFDCADLNGGLGLNWTDPRVVRGELNDSERAFFFDVNTGHTTYEHAVIEGSISGDLFTLPAGPVGGAFGAQYRYEAIDDNPGKAALARNMYNYSTAGITKGDDTIWEAFGELEVPILAGLPGVERLTANVSARYSDYESYGASSTYKGSLNWQITPAWRLRVTHGTSFRAPGLFELYLGDLSGFQGQAIDPCNDVTNNGVPDRVKQNCAAGIPGVIAGVPDTYIGQYNGSNNPSALVIQQGGAGLLDAETSKATTYSVIWTPGFIDLNVSVDYFEITVEDEIRRFGAGNILYQCYNAANFPNSGYCTLFDRDPTTLAITQVRDAYVNVAEQVNRGLDLTFDYRHEFDFGRFSLGGQFTWQFEDDTKLFGSSTPTTNNGATLDPDFTGQLNFRFDRGDWTAFWGVDFISKTSDSGPDQFAGDVFANSVYADVPNGKLSTDCSTPESQNYCVYYKQFTEFTALHSASVRYKFGDWTFAGGINNVFDERPPSQSVGQIRIGTAALGNFDLLGRRAFVQITKRW